jgi:hypothetical protein
MKGTIIDRWDLQGKKCTWLRLLSQGPLQGQEYWKKNIELYLQALGI